MKQALISPLEPRETGYRVAEVVDVAFEVAPPLFWIECSDDVVADQWYYDNQTGVINPVPSMPPAPDQPVSTGTQTL